MATAIAIIGGLGLFLLGMAVMTDGLKALAGSALRRVLARAAATPLRGTFWGAAVTMAVQSSSATTMTTIGLVSAGLLTFPQGLSLVFGANIGTTGTGWLVALLGVKFSLTATAMPLVFLGAMLKLLRGGRWGGAGGAIAGFALLLVGLTTLQQGMGGLAERLAPRDLPGVIGGPGVGWGSGLVGLLTLVIAGIVMTTVMQSSSAAIAVTLSALHAGAIGAEQAAAMVIGQNIGSAISSMVAAVGATTPAKRTAVAHVLFNVVTGALSLITFPIAASLLLWAAVRADPTTLLAAYHTAYKVAGVAILLPLIGPFARLVERIVPQRGPVFTRHLDRSVLSVPAVAVEAARRTVADVLAALCAATAAALRPGSAAGSAVPASTRASWSEAAEAMEQTRMFLSELSEPPSSQDERRRLAGALHALDHTARLVETLREDGGFGPLRNGEECARATALSAEALEAAAVVATAVEAGGGAAADVAAAVSVLAAGSAELANLRRTHRRVALEQAASGALTAGEAMARVEAVRRLDRVVYHAWRAAVHLWDGAAGAAVSEQERTATFDSEVTDDVAGTTGRDSQFADSLDSQSRAPS